MIIVCDTLRKIFVQIGDPRNILGLRFRCDAIYSELKLFFIQYYETYNKYIHKEINVLGPAAGVFCVVSEMDFYSIFGVFKGEQT